jgi:hypothetical protein
VNSAQRRGFVAGVSFIAPVSAIDEHPSSARNKEVTLADSGGIPREVRVRRGWAAR